MRALVRFGKHSRLKFVSHLDLQRVFHMAVRRTDLPIAYSQGFNPHPVLSFASALAMGWTSDGEIVDIKLERDVTEAETFREMAGALPPDLPVYEVRLVDDRFPAAMALVRMADYVVKTDVDLTDAVRQFLAMDECVAMRKTKSGETPTDIRPMSVMLRAEKTEVGTTLDARLMLTEKETLKPDLLVRTLAQIGGISPGAVAIHRKALIGLKPDGTAAPLMEM